MHEAYLDNAAAARPYPEVVEAVCAAMRDGFGNASAEHARGRKAHRLLEENRAVIAGALRVDPEELFFTSGGTESNNLAIRGAARAVRAENPTLTKVVASSVEHPSVTKSVRGLRREGWEAGYFPAKDGVVADEDLETAIDENTAVIACMRVQNETGFILPVERVAAARDMFAPDAVVHSDGVQAFGKIPFFPHELGADLASISSHKIGGPQGIGALYVKQGTPMFTTAFGGGQERGLRSGTEALPLVVGFACAVRIALRHREEAARRVEGLKSEMLAGVRRLWPNVRVNSREDGSPFIASFSVPGLSNAAALEYLSARGIYVSKASACKTLHPHVSDEDWRHKHPTSLQLCGVPKELVGSTLRVSFSQDSAEDDVRRLLAGLHDFASGRPGF